MKEILIREVQNGFLVTITSPKSEHPEELVFTSLESLTSFLSEYFKRKDYKPK
jgi:hypothetical protein